MPVQETRKTYARLGALPKPPTPGTWRKIETYDEVVAVDGGLTRRVVTRWEKA